MLTQPSMIKRPVLDHGGAEVKGVNRMVYDVTSKPPGPHSRVSRDRLAYWLRYASRQARERTPALSHRRTSSNAR
jgi:hypothetical protein